MLDERLLRPKRDGPLLVPGRQRITREAEGDLVRGDEGRDVG